MTDDSNTDDPELLGQLQAWFGQGPLADATHPVQNTRRPSAESQRKTENATRHVDPEFLCHLEAQGQRAGSVVEPLPEIQLGVEGELSRFDFGAWGLATGDTHKHRDRPHGVVDALRESAPQATLRDLHREVTRFHLHLEQTDLGIDRTGQGHSSGIRELLATKYKVDINECSRSRAMIATDLEELQATLQAPWEDSLPDEPKKPLTSDEISELEKWFVV